MTDELIQAAKGWFIECDLLEEGQTDDLTDAEVIQGIRKHFDGGISEFIACNTPYAREQVLACNPCD